jgi:hypothetical protein
LILLISITLISFSSIDSGSKPFNNQKCVEIDASVEALRKNGNASRGSIKIDFKNLKRSDFIVTVIGPKRLVLKDVSDEEVKELSRGSYSVVIVERTESIGYCPKHFKVEI